MIDDIDGTFDDPGSPGPLYERDVLGSPDDFAQTVLLWGTVGWEDEADIADKGDGSDTENGPTLIRVTAHQGALPGEPTSPTGLANGYRYKALAPLVPAWIPPRGTRCVLGFPDGPTGAPVILNYYGPSPSRQYGRQTAKMDFGDQNLVIKAKSITLVDAASNVLSMSAAAGIGLADETGSGLQSYQGTVMLKSVNSSGQMRSFVSLDSTLAQIVCCDGSGAKFEGTNTNVCGVNVSLAYLGCLGLGRKPTTPVLLGLTGPAGLPALSVMATLDADQSAP